MSYNNISFKECYYGTNIAPQAAKFNQQGWRILEGIDMNSSVLSQQ
jgi:DNA/RNA endonuclease G (NUC1)